MNPHRLLYLAKGVYRQAQEHDLSGAAAELSYRFFLALFPLFIFVAAMGGFIARALDVENPTQEIMDALGDSLPPDAASVLRDQLSRVIDQQNYGLLSIGILGAIWAASSGFGTIMKATNKANGVRERRSLPYRYAMALGMTVLGGLMLIGAMVLLLAGQVYGQDFADGIGLGGEASWLFLWGRVPAVVVLTLAATAIIYWLAPSGRIRFRWISPGAVLFAVSWIVVSYVFGQYVTNFGSYNVTYGTLGGVVIMLIWLYITAYELLIGAELNALLEQERVPRAAPPPVLPVAPVQPNGPLALFMGVVVALLALMQVRRSQAPAGRSLLQRLRP